MTTQVAKPAINIARKSQIRSNGESPNIWLAPNMLATSAGASKTPAKVAKLAWYRSLWVWSVSY
jgi:hypothetical protein